MVYLLENNQKINHFDIYSIWSLNYIEQVNFNMFNLTNGFFTSQIE